MVVQFSYVWKYCGTLLTFESFFFGVHVDMVCEPELADELLLTVLARVDREVLQFGLLRMLLKPVSPERRDGLEGLHLAELAAECVILVVCAHVASQGCSKSVIQIDIYLQWYYIFFVEPC